MAESNLEALRYPIGQFAKQTRYTESERTANLEVLRHLPALLRTAVQYLNDVQLDTPYREGGWTVRQVVHHLADSHMNGFIRHRLALTEDQPTIKPYEEAAWAELADAKTGPVEVSIRLLNNLHHRWTPMLESLSEDQLMRTYFHPISGDWTIEQSIANYAWHSEHHLAHITELAKRLYW